MKTIYPIILISLLVLMNFMQSTQGHAIKDTETKISYTNFAVFKIIPQSDIQRQLIEELTENGSDLKIWHSDVNEIQLMVNPKQRNYFENFTDKNNLSVELLIPNVQRLIDEESEAASSALTDTSQFGWTSYNNLASIEAWLDGILATYPDVTEGFIVGKSFEGRNIRGIKISYKSGNPGIFIESNIHAREWITSATATWFINELLTSDKNEVRQLAENIDWYIVPVFNVDGFVYTHERDRLWRKTRQPSATSECIGADPNRNWDSHWMESNGASSNPCSETYAGPRPFSEPEVKALADYIASIKDRLNIVLAFHSFSQVLLSPYGHTKDETPENYEDLMAVAKAYSDAVGNLSYKTDYDYGTSAGVMYLATGATIDWVYNEQDIKITYTIEFRDKGRFGFVLPPVQILPNCEEAMAGILALVKEAESLGYLNIKYKSF